MTEEYKRQVVFDRSETSNEPAREWLKSLSAEDRKIIGSV